MINTLSRAWSTNGLVMTALVVNALNSICTGIDEAGKAWFPQQIKEDSGLSQLNPESCRTC
jgi:hypothetical protein